MRPDRMRFYLDEDSPDFYLTQRRRVRRERRKSYFILCLVLSPADGGRRLCVVYIFFIIC